MAADLDVRPARRAELMERLTAAVPEHPPRDWLIESDEDVERALQRIAGELRRSSRSWPATPRRSGRSAGEEEAVTANALGYALEDARRDAGEAWQAKDLDRVVAILEPLEGHLERHEQGWLDYARRRRAR